jgi:hypothetical protein
MYVRTGRIPDEKSSTLGLKDKSDLHTFFGTISSRATYNVDRTKLHVIAIEPFLHVCVLSALMLLLVAWMSGRNCDAGFCALLFLRGLKFHA